MRTRFASAGALWALGLLLAASQALYAGERRSRGGKGGPGRGPDDNSVQGTLQQGAVAPDFEIQTLAAGKATVDSDQKAAADTVRLSSFRGDKPVLLIFGSYT